MSGLCRTPSLKPNSTRLLALVRSISDDMEPGYRINEYGVPESPLPAEPILPVYVAE